MNNFYINQKINPKGLRKDEYDVIIIGAGIGGLTCGCYLAKAGVKVLIIEQGNKSGGCCMSFKRRGFTFDATTHYLGSLRENGPLRKICNELEVGSKIEIMRFNPTNVVAFPERKIHIWTDINQTISELQDNFKHEAENIKDFLDFIKNSGFANLYVKLKNKTFKDFLDSYFSDQQLKSILGIFLGSNIGLPPSRASAFASVILYREFVLDGGYYPKGGMQAFSDAFVAKFKEYGGEIFFRKKAEKIVVEDQKTKGVIIDKDNFILSKIVVSNCDATNTFLKLIGKDHLPAAFIGKINNLEISTSGFIVYLGLNKSCSEILKYPCSWWCSLDNSLNLDKVFLNLDRKDKPYVEDILLCSFSSVHDNSITPQDFKVVFLFIPARMTNSDFWQENKHSLADKLIKKAEYFVPNLSKSIEVREIATPLTIHKYTSNRGGAFGWAATPLQMDKNIMPPQTFIEGLYLVGHWATLGTTTLGGISSVAYCGEIVAKLIMKNL